MYLIHKGAIWMLIATFFFALMGTFVKLGGENFNSTELVFYRSLISLLIIVGIMRLKKISFSSSFFALDGSVIDLCPLPSYFSVSAQN